METEMEDYSWLDPEEAKRLLESWKEVGDDYYRAKDYQIAFEYYTRAINNIKNFQPKFKAICLMNRSGCHFANSKYREAITDCQTALKFDPTFKKPRARILKCLALLGEFQDARSLIEEELSKNEDLKVSNPALLKEMIQFNIIFDTWNSCKKSFDGKDFRLALFFANTLLMKHGVVNVEIKLKKAHTMIKLKRWSDALELINPILCDTNCFSLRGLCFYYDGDIASAVMDFRTARDFKEANVDPKYSVYLLKASRILKIRDAGKLAFSQEHYHEAFVFYTEALMIDDTNDHQNSILYYNRAAAGMKLGELEEVLKDCNKAMDLKNTNAEALKLRGDCLKAMEKFDEALKDREALEKLQPKEEHKKLIEEAKDDLRRTRKKPFNSGIPEKYQNCSIHKNVPSRLDPTLKKKEEEKETDLSRLSFQHFYEFPKSDKEKVDPNDSAYLQRKRYIVWKSAAGKLAFAQKRFDKAFDLYTEALNIDQTNGHQTCMIHCNRAAAGLELGKLKESLDDCNKALKPNSIFIAEALKVRGDCYKAMEMFTEALRDREALDQLQPKEEHKKLIREAKEDLERSTRTDMNQ